MRSQTGTQRLVALSQFACVALFALLLVRSSPAGAPLTRAALVLSLAICAVAAGAVAVEARGVHRVVFGAFAALAGVASLAPLRALLVSGGASAPIGAYDALEMAVGVAALNAVLALYGTYASTLRQRESELLEESMMLERVLSTTLEQRVVESTSELGDAQRALKRMWWLGQQITLELDPARVLDRFLEAAVDTTQAAGAALGLLDEDGRIRIAAASGALGALQGTKVPLRDSAMGRTILTGRSWTAPTVAEHAATFHAPSLQAIGGDARRGFAAVPVVRRGDRIGAVVLVSDEPRAFTPQEIERVEAMADLLAVALANAELVETLRRAEWRFRTLFRAAPDAVFTLLQSGRIRDANDAVRELTGIEPSHLTGRFVFELVEEEDRAALSAAITRAIGGSAGERLEVRVVRWSPTGDHAVRHAAVALSRLPEADPPAALLVARDVTAERAMHVRLMESDRLAAVGELVAGVAHEVNNPLSSISAFSQLLLREQSLSAAHRESIEVIHAETQRASQVVKDLLAFARRSAPQREPVDLNVVVTRTLRLRQYQLGTLGITIEEELDATLPAVLGDARQLQQVCLNLVMNAVQAMTHADEGPSSGAQGAGAGAPQFALPPGGVLRVRTRRVDDSDGPAVQLEVSDTGTGIPAHLRPRIFEPFFTTKPEGEGTGLGLSVSYGIVRAHGGTIELSETSPAGSTFRVTLPAAGVAASESSDAAQGPAMLRSPLAGLRLLFVDDEPSLRSGMEAFGRMRGFTVVTAEDGLAALESLEGAGIDAVVCDLRMPRMDGLAFHAQLRHDRPGLAARTVFITGDVVAHASRQAGRQPVLVKPFSFEQLEEVLVGLLRGH